MLLCDRLRLSIPFAASHVTGAMAYLTAENAIRNGFKSRVDIRALGFEKLSSRAVSFSYDDNGKRVEHVDHLYHAFESLPTSFTDMAFKVYDDCHSYPTVEIKCSPAKLLQGHNVFGPDDIELGATEMIMTLQSVYPQLVAMLDIDAAQVMEVDFTASARVESEHVAQQIIAYLSNVSNGQTKARGGNNYGNQTCYWGGKNSRLKKIKAYLKSQEFLHQLNELRKKAESGCESAKRTVAVMEDPRLLEWVQGLIRFESTICKRYMERRDIPTRLIDLIKYQKQLSSEGRSLSYELWAESTADIFKAFEGQTMRVTDNDSVQAALRQAHFKMTPKGNISYTKADKLMQFYLSIRSEGYSAIKALTGNDTFYRNLRDLEAAGFDKAFLQNLNAQHESNIIPLLRMITVDFNNQRPDWYVEPKSSFEHLLKPASKLRLVA